MPLRQRGVPEKPPHAMPQAVVHISKVVEFFDFQTVAVRDQFGRLHRRLTRRAVNHVQRKLLVVQLTSRPLDLIRAVLVERDVKRSTDSLLIFEICRTGPNQRYL